MKILICSILLSAALLAQQTPFQMSGRELKPGAPVPPPAVVPPDKVVLTVGDMKFTREQFELLIQPQMRATLSQQQRRQMAEQIADIITLAAEARRKALDQTPYARESMDILSDRWLANELVTQQVVNKPLDDATVKAYYDQHPEEFEQVTARHILIRFKGSAGPPLAAGHKELTEAEALAKAQDLKKQLDAGADFAALAKANSDDTSNAANGGLLGSFGHGRMVPDFDKAAFAAQIGKVTDPVKTQFGYHLILVTEHGPKPLAEARSQIEQKLRPEVMKKFVEEIRTQTPITIEEAYFGKPEPPPAIIPARSAPTLGAPTAPAGKPVPATTPNPATSSNPATAPNPATAAPAK